MANELDYPSRQDFMQDIFEYANWNLTYFDDLVKGYYQGRYISNETY